ncbi:hypothetical protein F4V57_10980 [Acinetobacter qingfengensis]|uniref:Uncharacterized protein n=1 Tax=Acinetobacter qingfengensis TaxID=1262585 RepID=A0A1E7RDH0_9GAMM|nr:hypothetical protein [Acinetobacter qingfengensis]KAA8732136.1 hypothetical protein F4V57_10980 [Acinetobacter qingfengensis]OEY97215.1 hypothetical protein BJI46_01965 [Acinetobacter qingfengensis]
MRRLLYIVGFALLLLLGSLFLSLRFSEALPIAFIGGCLGWAVAEFKRETKPTERSNSDSR